MTLTQVNVVQRKLVQTHGVVVGHIYIIYYCFKSKHGLTYNYVRERACMCSTSGLRLFSYVLFK